MLLSGRLLEELLVLAHVSASGCNEPLLAPRRIPARLILMLAPLPLWLPFRLALAQVMSFVLTVMLIGVPGPLPA